jgi:hypothetical protein
MQNPRHAAADDKDALRLTEAGPPLAPQYASQRFHEHRFFVE